MPSVRKRKHNPVAAPRRHHTWLVQQISIGNLMSVGVIIFTGAGFYYSTSSALLSATREIETIQRRLADAEKKDDKQQQAVISERSTLRNEMTNRAEKTAEGIGELNKQTAVLSTQLTAIKEELVKLGTQIATIGPSKR